MQRLIICVIKGYQKIISPLFGNICRYEPSCSDYCIESIKAFGIIKGFGKTVLRIIRCHPWCSGGYDPIIEDVTLKKENIYS